jgi:hypothetical protein
MKALAPDLWIAEGGPQRVGPFALPIRMTVLRLADGGLWLHSPIPHEAGLRWALERQGPIRHLVAPSTTHWLHLAGWQAAIPGATSWGAPGLAAKLRGKPGAPRLDRELAAEPPPDWAGQLDHALFAAPGFAEMAFHHRASATLVLTDTLQNLETATLPPLTRLLVRIAGSAAPDGRAPSYLRALLRLPRHRAANRAAAERILAWQPRRVLFAHGAWYGQDATARLARAFAWALRP